MHFENLNSVVGQEVGQDEGTVLEVAVEAEYLAVVVKELFLGCYLTSSQFLLHVL